MRSRAQFVFKIDTLIKERGLKQIGAAVLLRMKQRDISKMIGIRNGIVEQSKRKEE